VSESRLESPENSLSIRRRKTLSAADAASLAAVELPASGLHSNPGNLIPYFERLAILMTPTPSAWLAPHLMRWSRNVLLGREVEARQPKRSDVRKTLAEIRGAVSLLQRALPQVREFLDAGGAKAIYAVSEQGSMLAEIGRRAEHASKSPLLMNQKGETKRGRGRALPSGAIPAQTYCALLIAETWRWLEGEYPRPHDMTAAAAAGLFWRLAGGQAQSWGSNPLEAWRYHLKKIPTLNAERDIAEYRRHLGEAERRATLIQDGN